MREIVDGLFVGDVQDAGRPDELRRRGVTSVVTLLHSDPDEPYPESVTVHRYPLVDGPQADRETFTDASNRLRELLAANETVFCHCSAGVSRSASVAAAALAVRSGESFEAALQRVERAKPNVNPHHALAELGRAYVTERTGDSARS